MKQTVSNSPRDRNLLAALRIVEGHAPDPILIKVLEAIEDRLTYHRNKLIKSEAFHSILNKWFSILIPLLSAGVTSAAALHDTDYAEGAGMFLTFLTVTNTALRPAEKSMNASYMLVRLHDWEMDLIITLQGFQNQENEKIYAYLKTKDSELSKAGAEIVDILSPSRQTADTGGHKGG